MGLLDKFTQKKKRNQALMREDQGTIRNGKEKNVNASLPRKSKTEKQETKTPKQETEKTHTHKKSHTFGILLQPVVSEKTARQEAGGCYTFLVDRNANKPSVAEAFTEAYGVRPTHVRTMHVEGKEVRFGSSFGRRSGKKKVIVSIPKGQTVSIHEGV